VTRLARVLAYGAAVLVWGVIFGAAAVLYAMGLAITRRGD
jgi:hypothetical protein